MNTRRPHALATVLVAASISLFAVVTTSCSSPAPAPDTVPPPEELTEMEAPIQRQFATRHQALNEVLALEDASDERKAKAFASVGKVHFAYAFLDGADAAFTAATELDPDEPRWAYYLARVRLELGRTEKATEEAEVLFRAVLDLLPHHSHTLAALAEIAAQRGDAAAAEAFYREALRSDPQDVRSLAGLATLAMERGEPEAALGHLEEALIRQPSAVPLHYQAALVYRALGDQESATRHLERVPSQNVTQVHLLVNDPWMREIEQLRIGARRHDQRALRALAGGRFDVAIVELRQALAANPDRIFAHHGLGVALARLGRTEEAIAELEQLLEVEPNHVPSLTLLAGLLHAEGRHDESQAALDTAIDLAPEDPQVLAVTRQLRPGDAPVAGEGR